MALPDGFPGKKNLEDEGYETVEEVSQATDEELLAVPGIAEGTLAKIRDSAPYAPGEAESGTGESSTGQVGPSTSVHPTAQSYEAQTNKISEDRLDPVTKQELPKGIVKNERGTLTANSEVDQADMVSMKQIEEEKKNRLRQAGERVAAALGA